MPPQGDGHSVKRHDSDPDLLGKDQERELRKAALRASHRRMNGSDPDLFAKEQEKELRKAAIRQSSNRSMTSQASDTSLASASDRAKEQEKELRKLAIRQASKKSLDGGSNHSMSSYACDDLWNTPSAPSSPAKKMAPKNDPDAAAKDREKQARKQMIQTQLSAKNVMAAAAAAPPASPAKVAAKMDPDTAAKDRERMARKHVLQTQLSAKKMSPAALTPSTPSPSSSPAKASAAIEAMKAQSKKDSDMTAKNREKQARQAMLATQLSTKKMAAAAAPSSPAKAMAKMDPDMAAKNREREARRAMLQTQLSAKNMPAAAAAPASPAKVAAKMDPDTAAKDREKMARKHMLQTQLSVKKMPAAAAMVAPAASPKPAPVKMAPVAAAVAAAAPPASPAKKMDPDTTAKERERMARKGMLQTQLSAKKMAPAAAVAPVAPASPKRDPDEAAKDRERMARKQAIHLSPVPAAAKMAPAAAVAAAPVMASPKKDPDMAAKDRERMARKQAIQNSPVAAAAAPVMNGGTPQSADASAKNREREARKGALQTQAAGWKLTPPLTEQAPPLKMPPAAAKMPEADQKIAPMEQAPPTQAELDAQAKRQAASGRVGAMHSTRNPNAKGARASNAEAAALTNSQLVERNVDNLDALAKQRAAARPMQMTPTVVNSVAPRSTEVDVDEMDRLAKQRARGGGGPATMVGAFSAPYVPMEEDDPAMDMSKSTGTLPGFESAVMQSGKVSTGMDASVQALNRHISASVQPVPETADLEAPTPGAFSFTPMEQSNQQMDALVADVEAPAPLQQPEPEEPSMESDTFAINSGLIEATLVEDVVEATVATAYQADDMQIRKQSAEETKKIKQWRLIVCLALLATAVAVTVSTYKLLLAREHENFTNVYAQFAKALGDSAVEQQRGLRDGLRMFADTVAMAATIYGNGTSPWPYFIVPSFETLAADFKKVVNAEFVGLQNYVTHDQRDSYIDFITPRYQDFVAEAHMAAYGHLDFLNNDTANYQPFIAQKLPNKSFVPDVDRDIYFCRTTQSPPARKYGPTINNNLLVNKVIGDGFAAVMELHTEPVFTTIKPFANLPADEHAKMHSNGAEGANNPHSFTFQPIHRVAGDQQSDIVAMFAVATAWDFSMLNLLPDNVKGMYAVLENTCNQTVTYRVDGADATYLGEGELQNKQYDDLAVFVDLNLQVHPNASTTPGHCRYWMTIYPSIEFENDYKTNTPAIYAAVVAITFAIIAVIYYFYDVSVTKRNEKMIGQAAKTAAILTNLVPEDVRDKIMGFEGGGNADEMEVSKIDWQNGRRNMNASMQGSLLRAPDDMEASKRHIRREMEMSKSRQTH